MEPTTVVMVWWLLLGGSANTGLTIGPVPYQDKGVCQETAREINQLSNGDAWDGDIPYVGAMCYSQPASDVEVWANQFYGSNGFGQDRNYGYGF